MLDRSAYSILVPSAGATAGIGVIRSLGAAGYRVHAAASDARALGLRSRFVTDRVIHPAPSSNEFLDWLRVYLVHHRINMVMPGWDAGLVLKPAIAELAKLFPLVHDANTIATAQSKASLFARLLQGNESDRANLPPSVILDFNKGSGSLAELAGLPLPLFIKVDGALARHGDGDAVIRAQSLDKARRTLEVLSVKYRMALVQGFVPGRGAGAFILRWNDRVIARMMHLRLHEMPHTGGASSLRRTWWHDAMMRDAEHKLQSLGWKGVAMVEYRWDSATDKFYLMEMNLRFWGSLHLALYAGVDFPRLLADAFLLDQVPDSLIQNTHDVVCRNTIPYEIGYLVSLWRDTDVPWWRKLRAAIEAISLSLNPRVRNDLFYPGDRGLYFERLKDFFTGAGVHG